jgi:hypothetical protein
MFEEQNANEKTTVMFMFVPLAKFSAYCLYFFHYRIIILYINQPSDHGLMYSSIGEAQVGKSPMSNC